LAVAILGCALTVLIPDAAPADAAQASGGILEFTTPVASGAQMSGSLSMTVGRIAGAAGPASVNYSTINGTAIAGTDYTPSNGTLYWADGDLAPKTITLAVSTAQAFSGTKNLQVGLWAESGALLGSPGKITATITGGADAPLPTTPPAVVPPAVVPPAVVPPAVVPPTLTAAAPCSLSGVVSYVTSNAFDAQPFGNYLLNNNNWGGTPGQVLSANGPGCWGVITTAVTDRLGIGSYPSVTRGWTQNQTYLTQLSTPGTNDWTTKSGMGIPVAAVTKARVHWAFTAPPAPNRWSALMDIYFHKTNAPDASMFYPQLDLMVEPAIADQVNSDGTTYYGSVITANHGTQVTIGGNTYSVYVDNPSQQFNQPGGHTIEMFMTPNSITTPGQAVWGANDSVTDVAAIIRFWMQTNPTDDAGNVILNAAGAPVGQVITPDLYLNVINAGFEIDDGTAFTTTAFCVAMQNEPDCS
jgi:hypothetical protein